MSRRAQGMSLIVLLLLKALGSRRQVDEVRAPQAGMQRPPTLTWVTPLLWLPRGCLSCPPSLTDPGCPASRLLLHWSTKVPGSLSHFCKAAVALHIPFLVTETLFLHLPSPTSLIFPGKSFLYPQAPPSAVPSSWAFSSS